MAKEVHATRDGEGKPQHGTSTPEDPFFLRFEKSSDYRQLLQVVSLALWAPSLLHLVLIPT